MERRDHSLSRLRSDYLIHPAMERHAPWTHGWLDIDRVIGLSWKSPNPICMAIPLAVLVIHTFIRAGRQGERKESSDVELCFDSINDAESFGDALWDKLKCCNRPQNLLVLVNPYGGKKKGRKIWQLAVSILSLASICVNVVETSYAGHARDVVTHSAFQCEEEIARLEGYEPRLDGVVCVGGDGLVNEVMEALHVRGHASHIPLGIVPAGSTDATAMSIMGTNDPVTAAIHIALGVYSHIDLIEVRTARIKTGDGQSISPSLQEVECLRNTQNVRYIAGALLYGYFGEVMRRSESDRMRNFFGTHRYDVAGALTLAALPRMRARVRFRSTEEIDKDEASSPWHERIGTFSCVNMFGLPCVSLKTPSGIVPELLPGAGYFVLILLNSRGGRIGMLRHLLKMSTKGLSSSAPGGAEFIRAWEVLVEPLVGREGCWNADGELIRPFQPGMILRSKICGKILMMGRLPSAQIRKATRGVEDFCT